MATNYNPTNRGGESIAQVLRTILAASSALYGLRGYGNDIMVKMPPTTAFNNFGHYSTTTS
jgi:hypothetical protein